MREALMYAAVIFAGVVFGLIARKLDSYDA